MSVAYLSESDPAKMATKRNIIMRSRPSRPVQFDITKMEIRSTPLLNGPTEFGPIRTSR